MTKMTHFLKKHWITTLLILLSLCSFLALKYAPEHPEWIEKYYVLGVNKLYRQGLSCFFGIFPFSFYEFLLYGIILFVLCYTIWRFGMALTHHNKRLHHLKKWFLHMLDLGLVIWLIFSLGWDLCYARLPLENSMALNIQDNSHDDLAALYSHLITQLNTLADQVERDSEGHMTISGGYQDVFNRTASCYDALSKDYPIFSGTFGRPKPIALSGPMLYTGITGIYAPFTCEPNINIDILPQSLPATALHEMAHERGFAAEDECNFIASLACSYSRDADFKYSGYMLALAYTSQILYKVDQETLYMLNSQLDPKVLLDVRHNNSFWKSYSGKTEKISSTLNDSYLKANGVTDGEASYGRMVNLLIAYYRTHPDY